ncbi:MAG: polysaccharide biosynthesis tyrosine autokinase, partial [Rhodospirillaceae bacterium]
TLARAHRSETEARLRQARGVLNGRSVDTASVAEVLNSATIQSLRQHELTVLRSLSELANTYGEKHPKPQKVRSELREIRDKIQLEVGRILQGLANQVEIARSREIELIDGLDRLQNTAAEQNKSEAQLRILEREAQANRAIFENFLTRFKETSNQSGMQESDARILSRAVEPAQASFPDKRMIVMTAMMLAGLLGVALAFLLDEIESGFISVEQVENELRVPALGLVPQTLTNLSVVDKQNPLHWAVARPLSVEVESLRHIATSLLISCTDQPPKIILVTSALAGEGKTFMSCGLAQVQAMAGSRVLLIDCDLRRPSVHKALGVPNKKGLADMLAGKAGVNDVINIDARSGLNYITAGSRVGNTMLLLSSKTLRRAIELFSQQYDLIILDSSPILLVADGRVLSTVANATVMVVRWYSTRRNLVVMACEHLTSIGATVAGFVLNNVDISQHSKYYSYKDSGLYNPGYYKQYYGNNGKRA